MDDKEFWERYDALVNAKGDDEYALALARFRALFEFEDYDRALIGSHWYGTGEGLACLLRWAYLTRSKLPGWIAFLNFRAILPKKRPLCSDHS